MRCSEQQSEARQEPTLADPDTPDWYKSAVFNELYYLVDGGSVWLEVGEEEQTAATDPRKTTGRWGYLESYEYRMYNTYDVHCWALVDLFPEVQVRDKENLGQH